MNIVKGDLDDPRVIALFTLNFETNHALTPAESVHTPDIDSMRSPDMDFWTVWDGESLLAMAALKQLGDGHGEIKAVHTAEASRRTGAASLLMRHLIDSARAQGMERLSLETGSFEYFAPARGLYEKFGFSYCPPFGDYTDDPNSVYMTLDLRMANAG
ncbi:MAG: GNAT family N-acetyltransferase [Alphaproteobacteria bacterium]|nr:GNAT family N-acetyltransferase [Alphaproteobacteria bacterium]